MLSKKVIEAVKDVRFLLDRGFPRDSAVEFVSDHHLLELEKRHLITRCVFSQEEAKSHKDILLEPDSVRGARVGVDGYNVLITVESILNGEQVIRCDDGFIRDLQTVFGSYSMSEQTEAAVKKIFEVLTDMGPSKVFFYFDKQASKSGELSGYVRREMAKSGIEGDAQTARGVDAEVWSHEVSASSDRVIIDKSGRVIDLPSIIIRKKEGVNLIDLTEIERFRMSSAE